MDFPLCWTDAASERLPLPELDFQDVFGLPSNQKPLPEPVQGAGPLSASPSAESQFRGNEDNPKPDPPPLVQRKDAIIVDLLRRNRALRAAVTESSKLLHLSKRQQIEINAVRARLAKVEIERTALREQVVKLNARVPSLDHGRLTRKRPRTEVSTMLSSSMGDGSLGRTSSSHTEAKGASQSRSQIREDWKPEVCKCLTPLSLEVWLLDMAAREEIELATDLASDQVFIDLCRLQLSGPDVLTSAASASKVIQSVLLELDKPERENRVLKALSRIAQSANAKNALAHISKYVMQSLVHTLKESYNSITKMSQVVRILFQGAEMRAWKSEGPLLALCKLLISIRTGRREVHKGILERSGLAITSCLKASCRGSVFEGISSSLVAVTQNLHGSVLGNDVCAEVETGGFEKVDEYDLLLSRCQAILRICFTSIEKTKACDIACAAIGLECYFQSPAACYEIVLNSVLWAQVCQAVSDPAMFGCLLRMIGIVGSLLLEQGSLKIAEEPLLVVEGVRELLQRLGAMLLAKSLSPQMRAAVVDAAVDIIIEGKASDLQLQRQVSFRMWSDQDYFSTDLKLVSERTAKVLRSLGLLSSSEKGQEACNNYAGE